MEIKKVYVDYFVLKAFRVFSIILKAGGKKQKKKKKTFKCDLIDARMQHRCPITAIQLQKVVIG